jgi:hypothetical protein
MYLVHYLCFDVLVICGKLVLVSRAALDQTCCGSSARFKISTSSALEWPASVKSPFVYLCTAFTPLLELLSMGQCAILLQRMLRIWSTTQVSSFLSSVSINTIKKFALPIISAQSRDSSVQEVTNPFEERLKSHKTSPKVNLPVLFKLACIFSITFVSITSSKMANPINPQWYVPQSYTTKDRLTFGVEIEFALPSLPEGVKDPHPDDPRTAYGISDDPSGKKMNLKVPTRRDYVEPWTEPSSLLNENARNHIAKTFKEAGIQSEVITGATIDSPMAFDRWKPKDPRSWAITHDRDVLPPDNAPQEYRWHGMELNSPPLYFSPEAIREVMHVIELVTSTYRCALTRRTTLHVHVGNSTIGFTPETLQKLAATYLTFEPALEQIHPYFRIDNLMTASLRRGCELSGETLIPEKEKRTVPHFLEYILQDENCDIKELKKAVASQKSKVDHSDNRGALNFSNIDTGRSTKNTVEFRQHTSSLDPQEIAHWIRLCVGFLEFVDTVEKERLKPFLEEHIGDGIGDFGLENALVSLGLPREAGYFGRFLKRVAGQRNAEGQYLGTLFSDLKI